MLFDPEAKWRVISDDLRAQIAQGKLLPGDPVPSERVLAEQWNVARMTARAAVMELVRAGLVTRGQRRRVARYEPLAVHISRTYDRTWVGESPTVGADSWVGDMHRAGREPSQLIEVFTTTAGEDIGQRLEIGRDGGVIARRLIRRAGDQIHNLITFWFPLNVAEGTPIGSPVSIEEGSIAWLERTRGPLNHEVEVSARMPAPEEAGRLDINSGSPVLVVWRTSRDTSQPVVTSMAVYPADRAKLVIDP